LHAAIKGLIRPTIKLGAPLRQWYGRIAKRDAHQTRGASSCQAKSAIFGCTKRELTRRSAIERVIGHMKAEGREGRGSSRPLLYRYISKLARMNVVLCAIG
jgi:hypothetical protein